MPFLYHIKSALFQGDTIYPLNQLRERSPEVYARQRRKYVGREALMERRVPLLDKLWNDVVHLAPVHPYCIRAAFLAAGANPDGLQGGPADTWVQIPAAHIAHLPAVYFTFNSFKHAPPVEVIEPAPEDFSWFSAADYRELPDVEPATIASNRERIALGMPPLLLTRTLHVLVDGAINIAGLPVVSWHELPAGHPSGDRTREE